MVIRLDTVASNLENRGTSRPVGWWVFRLDAIAASYYTKGKRSTGWVQLLPATVQLGNGQPVDQNGQSVDQNGRTVQ